MADNRTNIQIGNNDESSESENETEPAKIFHRRLSTKDNIKTSVATKEGFLMKQTWTFNRWRRRYFRLKGRKLYYAKSPECELFDEIDLCDLCFAECSTKNVNHTFQVITPTRSLVLGAETRKEMEDWMSALKAASSREFFDSYEPHDFLSGNHHWYATSHTKPCFCNVCREGISGVTSHGLSCEVCKCKVHKKCAAKAIANCKWTTLASVGKEIIEDIDGNLVMPHQWMEGNLPVYSKCIVCDKVCGSVLRLQDWRCLWCRGCVHTACRPKVNVKCNLGNTRVSVVPPVSLHSIGLDESWDVGPGSFSPLLVFVNSKSGDNQGVKFLRRFKQLLNPAQVFDLISSGPGLGLRLFRHFDPFRILICSGDGSVGWVLSEIDRLNMLKQCQVGVLPLGTGNDLARVLGWGSSCDDDAHLPQLLERYEKSSTKMLDRWSIMVLERNITISRTPKMSMSHSPDLVLTQFEDSAMWHLQSIMDADDFSVIISSTKTLCEVVNNFLSRISDMHRDDEDLSIKCDILRQKLMMLIETVRDEEGDVHGYDELITTINEIAFRSASEMMDNLNCAGPSNVQNKSIGKSEKDKLNKQERTSRQIQRGEKEAFQCRANSIKRAIRSVIKHTDDKQRIESIKKSPVRNFKINIPSSTENSPCPSPLPIPSCSINLMNSPSCSTTRLSCISPFPDVRRESVDENFLNTLSIPVPRQFADESRRNSGVPEDIQEVEESEERAEEENNEGQSNISTSSLLFQATEKLSFEYNKTSTVEGSTKSTHEQLRVDSYMYNLEQREKEDNLFAFRPIEVYERNLLRNLQQQQQQQLEQEQQSQHQHQQNIPPDSNDMSPFSTSKTDEITVISNSLQIPTLVVPTFENPPERNIYLSDNMAIIDTDQQQEKSSSDEIVGETSDVVSALSNDECSVGSEILDRPSDSYPMNAGDIIQDLDSDCRIGHIDSPENSDNTDVLHGESLMDDISSVLGHDVFGPLQDSTITDDTTTLCTVESSKYRKKSLKNCNSNATQFGFENRVFDLDLGEPEPTRYCSLAQFDGNDIARKSFKRLNRNKSASLKKQLSSNNQNNNTNKNNQNLEEKPEDLTEIPLVPTRLEGDSNLNTIKIQIQGSHSDLSEVEYEVSKKTTIDYKSILVTSDNEGKDSRDNEKSLPRISFVVDPPSPAITNELRAIRNEYRRHSSHTPSNLAPREIDINRRHSGHNPNLLTLDSQHMKFLNCSPAASRRISCGSLFKPNETLQFGSSKNIFGSKFIVGGDKNKDEDKNKNDKKDKEETNKKLPIINPLVQLPSWPNITGGGSGFISKCLLANADTLCAAVSPLMDPDETLMEGFYEKVVMNNYFGIGIDAKISLDFHNKREEHPEKCRSRAKNYMWYGVLGSKQLLQKTYKNLDQRVQLECDGQRIPLPSLQGIVVLNIPSFMGGTNFWGSNKENECFLAPSFDDKILEVVAVFGSVQMAASRLINLQHHRIAQCQSVQINILGDEGVPIQVDGEAWLQSPGVIRILHKNRVQMLCRNRSLEMSLKSWQEKQRQHSISIAKEQTSVTSEYASALSESLFTERETYFLLNFIECVATLVKWVKFLIISHPSLQPSLYMLASKTADSLENIHPGGKLLEGPTLRTKLTELVNSSKQLYEDTCELLRERGHSLIMREDLESKLSAALANMEMEIRKVQLKKDEDGTIKAYLNCLAPNEEVECRKKNKPFWLRFRGNRNDQHQPGTSAAKIRSTSREAVANWGVNEVSTWLEAMQMTEYVDSFVKNDIRGKELLTLARRDLKDLGVMKVGHVKRILQAIKDLGSN